MKTDAPTPQFFLSTLAPTDGERRLAMIVVALSLIAFAVALPFAQTPLVRWPVFIAIYQSMLVVCDVITAVLLFGKASMLRSRALALLAGGYLFTAAMAVAHMLTFPGLFAADGLLGAGTQSTVWLYMFWHAGFPLAVIAYAAIRSDAAPRPQRHTMTTCIAACVAGAIGLAVALAVVTTSGHALLPTLLAGGRYTPAMIVVVGGVWLLSLLALVVVWRRRPRTTLDLWLMVVLCAWLLDIALSAVFNAARFDLGFYAGRIYGLLAASFVLCVLLLHTLKLYARLAASAAELQRSNRDLDDFAYIASHDLKEPLRGLHNYASFLQEDYGDRLDDEGKHYLERMQRLVERLTALIDGLLAYSRLGSGELPMESVALDPLLDEVAEDLGPFLAEQKLTLARATPLPGVHGNALRIREIFQNLITNAAKYNDKADKQVEIGFQNDAIYVRDNGIGIAPQHQESIFRIFKRLHEQNKYGGGTGAGLTIVKKIIERHGGRIWLESAPGTGTTFYFTLQGNT